MKRFLVFLIPLICGCEHIYVDSDNSTSVKIPNSSKSQVATNVPKPSSKQYDNAYRGFNKEAFFVKGWLNRNTYGVQSSMTKMVKCLMTMKRLTAEPYTTQLAEFVQKYKGLREQFIHNSYSGVTIAEFDNYNNQISDKYAPNKVAILLNPPPEEDNSYDETDKILAALHNDTLPNTELELTAPPPKEYKSIRAEKAKEIETSTATPYEVYFKTWQDVHSDFVKAATDSKNLDRTYTRMKDSLNLLSERVSKEQSEKLKLYSIEYERIYNLAIKDGKDEDLLNSLKILSDAITQNFSPKTQAKK